MITVFKNKEDIPQNMEYVELNDYFFNKNTVTKIDGRAERIIEKIDNAKLISQFRILSEFDDVAVDIDKLSTGCKTTLNVMYYPDKVFCLKECGMNALEVIYELNKGNGYSDYAMIPFGIGVVEIQMKSGRKIINNYEELKEWWENEE